MAGSLRPPSRRWELPAVLALFASLLAISVITPVASWSHDSPDYLVGPFVLEEMAPTGHSSQGAKGA
jgi:hypothetical protein